MPRVTLQILVGDWDCAALVFKNILESREGHPGDTDLVVFMYLFSQIRILAAHAYAPREA